MFKHNYTLASMLTFLLLSPFLSIKIYSSEDLLIVTEEWYPYNYLLPDGQVGGVVTDSIIKAINKTGYSYNIKLYPWSRAYDLALNNKNVLIYSIVSTKDREDLFHWICPVYERQRYFFYKLSYRDDINIDSLEDTKKYRVAVTKDYFAHKSMLKIGFKEGTNLYVTSDVYVNVRMMLTHRIDFIII